MLAEIKLNDSGICAEALLDINPIKTCLPPHYKYQNYRIIQTSKENNNECKHNYPIKKSHITLPYI